ncbi:MAG: Ldh family oxidoreductase [Thermodesulfobacteriota bacterium]
MRVAPDRLKEITIEILRGLKASAEESVLVAESLVQADMRGIDTHGVNFLKPLADRVDVQMIDLPTRLKVIKEDVATGLIDGGNGLGQVAAQRAMTMSIQKAQGCGVGCCLVRNTNNIGFLAFYTLMAARKGMVGIIMTNGAASMSPWGGAQPFFGTNPLSIAVPGGAEDPAIVLDMSSSLVARGKIRRAHKMKENIPLGWAFDEAGNPTADPAAALKGTLAPMGGPKGYGLALMVDILAGMLSGSKYGTDVKTFHQPEGPTGVGVCCMAIDVERFMDQEKFRGLVQSYVGSIRGSKKAKGVFRIYLPGEIEAEKEKLSLKDGIEISPVTAKDLNDLLEKGKSPLRLNGR